MPIKDITGQKFGRLTAIIRKHKRIWEFSCECGNKKYMESGNVISGKSSSCGCLHIESITKHGKSGKSEYKIWCGMKARCYRKSTAFFKHYGGRGITMCERWRDSFENFYADMGPRPSPKHSIDRIDVNGNYEPGNCRWATPIQQMNNTRRKAKSGHSGITFEPSRNKYRVEVAGKYIGRFSELDEAISAKNHVKIC